MRKKALNIIAATGVILLVLGAKWSRNNLGLELPNYPRVKNTVWLEQNWTPAQRDWFQHADLGTQTVGIPYEWFMALEQPTPSLVKPGLLSDPVYLDQLGFIPSDTRSSTPELPIGFAHGGPLKYASGAAYLNPQTSKPMTSLGLTCAACHTGRINYQNTSILIDGAPAMANLSQMWTSIGLSLVYTHFVPSRFDRFANRVLGASATAEAKSDLKAHLDLVLSEVRTFSMLMKGVQSETLSEGYGRMDYLNRIGNSIFSSNLGVSANFVGLSAPVHFPRIWNASWFEWAQYNGSIKQPMIRNATKALGLGAPVNLTGNGDELFSSTIRIQNIFDLEQLVAGNAPRPQTGFNGLASPKWPGNILPPINRDFAAKGAVLYKEMCQGCHLPPVSDPAFWNDSKWTSPNSAGERHLNLMQVSVDFIGTDPAQAKDMRKRQIVLPANLRISATDFPSVLGEVVAEIVNHWYDTNKVPQSKRNEMNGYRANVIRGPDSYKASPLSGIWAAPPYLHNGSVPSLYALLSPVAERPKKFFVGAREYDPINVGYRSDSFPGAFVFDTGIPGNHNAGHEFSNDAKPGVIGPWLTPDERRALVEYLKTF
jgi:hypothetical protein